MLHDKTSGILGAYPLEFAQYFDHQLVSSSLFLGLLGETYVIFKLQTAK